MLGNIIGNIVLPLGCTEARGILRYERAYRDGNQLLAHPLPFRVIGGQIKNNQGGVLQGLFPAPGDPLAPPLTLTYRPIDGPQEARIPGSITIVNPVANDGNNLNVNLTGAVAVAATPEQLASLIALLTAGQAQQAQTQQVLAEIKQIQELNNAAAAQLLGRMTAPSVAEIGAAAGLYNITSGSEAGQVWERLAGGATVRREALEAASAASVTDVQQRVAARLAQLNEVQSQTGRLITELGAFDIVPEAQAGPANGGTRQSIGVPGYVAKLGSSGPLDFRLFRPDLGGNGAAANTQKLNDAISEALSSHETPELILPPGVLAYNGGIEAESSTPGRHLRLRGAGMGVTLMLQQQDADGLNIDLSVAQGQASVSHLSLIAGQRMTAGAAIRCKADQRLPPLVVEYVEIARQGAGHQWRYGIHGTNLSEALYFKVLVNGDDNSALDAFYFTADGRFSIANKLIGCSVYKAARGVVADNFASNPGIEGLQLIGCDIVDVKDGVSAYSNAPGYVPPQVSVMGGHINAKRYNVKAEGYTEIELANVLLYMWGPDVDNADYTTTARAVHAVNGAQVSVIGCQVAQIYGANSDAIELANINGGVISGNHAALGAGSQSFITLAGGTHDVVVTGNKRDGGGATVSDVSSGVNHVSGNYPCDLVDFRDSLSVVSGKINVARLRSGYGLISAAGGTVISAIEGIPPTGNMLVLQSDTAVTLNHQAGCILRGGADFTFSPGQTITLKYDGERYREIARQ